MLSFLISVITNMPDTYPDFEYCRRESLEGNEKQFKPFSEEERRYFVVRQNARS